MNEKEIQSALGPGAVFPVGGENTAFARYFVGTSYLNMLTTQAVSYTHLDVYKRQDME